MGDEPLLLADKDIKDNTFHPSVYRQFSYVSPVVTKARNYFETALSNEKHINEMILLWWTASTSPSVIVKCVIPW